MTQATDDPLSVASTSAPESDAAPSPPPRDRPAVEVAWSSPDVADANPDRWWATCWLTDRDVAVFTAVAAAVLALLVVRWGELSGWGATPVEIERLAPLELDTRLDLNAATWVELSQLDGVGETLAERIVERREMRGPFESVDDLDAVKGIGPKTLERLRPHLVVMPAQE